MFIRILALGLGLISLGVLGWVFLLGATNPIPYLLAAVVLMLVAVAMLVGHTSYLIERWMDYVYKRDTNAKK